MSPDPLSPSQREILDAALNKQAQTMASRNLRVADAIEAQRKREVRAWTVAFVAFCLAALCLMLFVRARYVVKASELTIDNGTGPTGRTLYCAKKEAEWICEYDPKKLEAEVEPEPTSFGTQPERVEL